MTENTNINEELNDEQTAENTVTSEETAQNPETGEQTETLSETEKLAAKFNEVNDKYLRLYSDFENFRKQKIKERSELLQTAGADVMKSVLSILDDFDRAIAINEKTEDVTALKEGFKLIHSKLKSTLERQGLKEIEASGKDFDTDLHEALTNIPAPSDALKGKVVDVAEKGYFLNDKVIRFAKVIVGQ
ncbi:MAG: nucleotide exchange factor GrpE [Bacteroidota bacterium]